MHMKDDSCLAADLLLGARGIAITSALNDIPTQTLFLGSMVLTAPNVWAAAATNPISTKHFSLVNDVLAYPNF